MKVFLLIYLLLTVFIAYRIFLVDFFFGVFCLFFVVYSIFPLFGYSYLPELSAVIGMYFGESVFFDAILFSAGSFISIYVFFKLIYCPLAERIYFRAHKSIRLTGPGILLMALHLLSNAYFLISYGDILTYQNASDEKFISAQGIEYAL